MFGMTSARRAPALLPATFNTIIVLFAVFGLSACEAPRGAALQSEILDTARQPDTGFAVVPVTRANLPALGSWPATGRGHLPGWIGSGSATRQVTIRPGDRIDLAIWDSQENSLLTDGDRRVIDIKDLPVAPDGRVFMPYVGHVTLANLTPDTARESIQRQLEAIVPSAQVQLWQKPGDASIVDMVGGVERPGRYPVPEGSPTVLSLIAEAGGISSTLRNPVVRLQRSGHSYAIVSSALLADPARNAVLRGGDRVSIESDPRVFVALGATGTQRLVAFDRPTIGVLEALSMLGGLADNRANLKGVLILREYPESALRTDSRGPAERQVVFTLDLTGPDGLFAARGFKIQPDDVLLATESPIPAGNRIVGFVGSLFGLGSRL